MPHLLSTPTAVARIPWERSALTLACVAVAGDQWGKINEMDEEEVSPDREQKLRAVE